MSAEYTCGSCGYVGPKPSGGQLIDWISAIFGMLTFTGGDVAVWKELLHPSCPKCHRRSEEVERSRPQVK
jgi:predicted RNA-binding Zn-ribbon protein involved in translation (DUF1610 family)